MRLFLVFLFLLINPGGSFGQESLTIAAASSLQAVLEELKITFQKDTGIEITIVTGSSGKLAAQIENGAPFDIFLSADMKYPQALYEKGLSTKPPAVYTYGVLIIWSARNIDLLPGMSILKEESVKKIALANPDLAPYGREAVHTLEYYNLYEAVKEKLVYGENISQVNDFVVSRAADVGFTAKSTVFNLNLKEKVVWIEVPPEAYIPIVQGAIILKIGEQNHPKSTEQFLTHLFSSRARDIFNSYGYNADGHQDIK